MPAFSKGCRPAPKRRDARFVQTGIGPSISLPTAVRPIGAFLGFGSGWATGNHRIERATEFYSRPTLPTTKIVRTIIFLSPSVPNVNRRANAPRKKPGADYNGADREPILPLAIPRPPSPSLAVFLTLTSLLDTSAALLMKYIRNADTPDLARRKPELTEESVVKLR